MSRRKDTRVKAPDPLQQRARAETRAMTASLTSYAAAEGVSPGDGQIRPFAQAVLDDWRRWVRETRCGPSCRHVWRGTPLATWTPTRRTLLCGRCSMTVTLAEAETDENWTCDLCRKIRPAQEPSFEPTFLTVPAVAAGGLLFPPVMITFGTCEACRTAADLSAAVAEIFAGIRS